MHKKLIFAAILAAMVIPPLCSQNAAVFAPFVSRFQAEIKNNLVRLSWVDSLDVRGPVYIYRSGLPFDNPDTVIGKKPIEIPYGVQSFVDEIENGGTIYYFAAASDETGRSYDIPIASSNTISLNIPADSVVPALVIPERVPDGRTPGPRGISSLEAKAQGDRILISFDEGDVKSASLYRSTRPISQTADLLRAVIIQTKTASPYTDYPAPGIPYYYAVIAEEDLVKGTVEIIPGRNVTGSPVAAGGQRPDAEGREPRAMPLPQISARAAIPGTHTETPPQTELSSLAAKAVGSLPAREALSRKPRVFARDLEAPPAGGEEHALSVIVKGPFAAKNWEAAKNDLVRFLALPRTPELKARAKFYLGQCYYFLRIPRDGIFEFLAIQDKYPLEASEWIQASLDMMKN